MLDAYCRRRSTRMRALRCRRGFAGPTRPARVPPSPAIECCHDHFNIHTVCMTRNRPPQAARSAATRDALVAAARALFAEHGYADVGTEEIVRAAGLTRGALYHHFADKVEVFAAAFEQVEAETNTRIADAVAAAGTTDPVAAMRVGASAFFDTCTDPQLARIM